LLLAQLSGLLLAQLRDLLLVQLRGLLLAQLRVRVLAFLVVPGIDELLVLIVGAYMHFEEVVLCCDVGVNRNQVDATSVGVAVRLTWEASHIRGRVAVFIDADIQEVGKLYQHELKPRCLPAVGEGARKNNGFAGVEVQWVVLRGGVAAS
jgi:hypothetical protein